MRNADLAEWLLTLVASRERAAAMTGDLLEFAGTRGAFWFWRAIVFTMLVSIARDLASSPGRFTLFVVHAAMRALLLSLLGAMSGLIVFAVIAIPFAHVGAPDVLASPFVEAGQKLLLPIGVSYFIGRWIGREMPGQELTGCVILGLSGGIVRLVMAVLRDATAIDIVGGSIVILTPQFIAMLAGALLVRLSRECVI